MMARILCCCLLCSCVTLPKHVPDSARVLTGKGRTVSMVKLEGGDWIIEVRGTTGPLDGIVARYSIDNSDYGYRIVAFETVHNGREYGLVQRQTVGDVERWQLYPMEKGVVSVPIQPSEQTVDVEALLREYIRQSNDGTLDAFARFDREGTIARYEASLRERTSRWTRCTGEPIELSIDWDSFDEESFAPQQSKPHLCKFPLEALNELCSYAAPRRVVSRGVQRVECRFGPIQTTVLEDGVLRFVVPRSNQGRIAKIKDYLLDEVTWSGIEGPLRTQVVFERSTLCTNGKDYVGFVSGFTPEEKYLFFGNRETLRRVRPPEKDYLDRWLFFDPRYSIPGRKITDDGVDHRYYSELRAKKCQLFCGTRTLQLDPVKEQTKNEIFTTATIEPPLEVRRPHALARDRRGVYYLVDVGHEPDARDFRVYVGRKGDMRALTMVNVVTDSQGQIFETDRGKLRLVLERETSFWIAGKKKTELTNLPTAENREVIYHQLGIYVGQPYGTPCDIF